MLTGFTDLAIVMYHNHVFLTKVQLFKFIFVYKYKTKINALSNMYNIGTSYYVEYTFTIAYELEYSRTPINRSPGPNTHVSS